MLAVLKQLTHFAAKVTANSAHAENCDVCYAHDGDKVDWDWLRSSLTFSTTPAGQASQRSDRSSGRWVDFVFSCRSRVRLWQTCEVPPAFWPSSNRDTDPRYARRVSVGRPWQPG